MQTLNQRLIIFNRFANDHKQINSYGNGELWELTEKDGERVYPLMWTVIEQTSISGNEEIDNYTFVFCDLVRPDENNENDVLSDQKSIAYDFVSFLRYSTAISSGTNVIKQITLNSFTEKFEDCLSGWLVNVQIKQGFIWDFCNAPMDGNVSGISDCRPVLIYENGILVDTVAAGGKYEYTTGGLVEITVNSAEYANESAPGSIDIPILNTSGVPVGTVTAGSGVLIADDTVTNSDASFNSSVVQGVPKILSDIEVRANNVNGVAIATETKPAAVDVVMEIPSGSLSNSDGSYLVEILPSESIYAPDINLTQPNGDIEQYPSIKDLSCTQINALTNQDLNDNLTPTQISRVQRQQPTKTGQTVQYRANDDGDLEMGIGASFSTLSDNNIFGNTNRFTDDLGGQTYTNNFVLDHLTGLMWYRSLFSAVNWNTAIDNAASSTQGGFSDWVLPNVNQATTIHDRSKTSVTNWVPFNFASNIWTSTTDAGTTTSAWVISGSGAISSLAKTSTRAYVMVRAFIPSDFGL